jgi:hypothetical protein
VVCLSLARAGLFLPACYDRVSNSKGGRLLQSLYYNAITVAMITFFAAPLMKFFARDVPFLAHVLIFFVSAYLVYSVFFVILIIGSIFKLHPGPFTGVYALVVMVPATGWLVTRILAKYYGIPTKFPAIGAMVMFILVPILSIIVVFVVRSLGI